VSSFYTVITGRIVQGHELCNATAADGEVWTPEAKLEALRGLRITHVLNLNDGRYWGESGFLYHFAPLADDKQDDKPVEWFKDCLEFVLPLLAQPTPRFYFHCVAGVARSSAITYAVLRAVGVPAEMARSLPEVRPGFEPVYLGSAERAVRELGYA
jgi:hypothetical protein